MKSFHEDKQPFHTKVLMLRDLLKIVICLPPGSSKTGLHEKRVLHTVTLLCKRFPQKWDRTRDPGCFSITKQPVRPLQPQLTTFLFLDHRVLLQPFFIQFLFLAGFSELWTKKILRWRHRRYQTLAPIFYSECFGLNYIYSYIGKHPQLSVKLTVTVQYSELQGYADYCSLPYNCKKSSYNIASFS